MSVVRCRAKGGPAACRDDRCPERQALMLSLGVQPVVPVREGGTVSAGNTSVITAPSTLASRLRQDGVLFRTVHGSRLYGLAHAGSDEDYFTITAAVPEHHSRRIRQKVSADGLDSLSMDFSSFVKLATDGSPQALEAMFSRQASVSEFDSYMSAFRAGGPVVVERYLKTIKSMALDDSKPFKHRRHALRLSLNLDELVSTGRFEPTLSAGQVELVSRVAELEGPKFFRELNRFQPFDLDWEQWLVEKAEKERLKLESAAG